MLGFFVKHMVLVYIQDLLNEGLDGFGIFITWLKDLSNLASNP